METVDLEANQELNECRLCLLSDPLSDLIHPCQCIGTLRYTHRKCLDRWRTVSPHPDSLTHCEICKSKYKLLLKNGAEDNCFRKTQYCLAVTLDLTFFIVIFMGLWIGFGVGGDHMFNHLIDIETECHNYTGDPTWWDTKGCGYLFAFTREPNLWTGRIWFWGFICLFFFLGIIGCCVACCCKDSGEITYAHPDSNVYYRRSDCYWIWCGPTYYGGYYYGSPYGYWDYNDILCCWICMNFNQHHLYHHNHSSGCNCGSCDNCGGGVPCDCKGNNMGGVLLVIVAIIVLIVVVCGVIFAAVVTFLVVNKILKRHLYLLEKRQRVEIEMVVDLDNPAQVAQASVQEEQNMESVPHLEKEPLLNPVGKNYDA